MIIKGGYLSLDRLNKDSTPFRSRGVDIIYKGINMKKSEISNLIEELLKDKVEDTTLEKVLQVINQTSTKRPKDITIDGKNYRYCSRHKLYEPTEWFLIEKSGKIKPECAAAYYRWQEYGKLLNKAMKNGEDADIGRLTRLRKSEGYDLEADANVFKDKIKEALDLEINPELALAENTALIHLGALDIR